MASQLRKRFVYDPSTKEMVEVFDQRREFGTLVVGDLPDFVSPVDGKVVHGRAGLREHDRRNGTTNIADYSDTWRKTQERRAAFAEGKLNDRGRTEAIARAYNDLAEGRAKRRT